MTIRQRHGPCTRQDVLYRLSLVKSITYFDMKKYENGVLGAASAKSASAVESTQWTKYHSQSGHGFAAEDANALHDVLCRKSVDKVGLNNELNGADRIVDGSPVQTKYYKTAYDSVNAAFDKDNMFRYPGQKIEVPKDQFE